VPAAKKTAAKKVAPTKKTAAKNAAPKKPPAKKAVPKSTPINYEFFPLSPGKYERGSLPFNFADLPGMFEALDRITAAAEAGKLTQENWVGECFGTVTSFDAFLDELTNYDDCFRINDRWYSALAHLAGTENLEEGFITTADMAHELRNSAAESNQL